MDSIIAQYNLLPLCINQADLERWSILLFIHIIVILSRSHGSTFVYVFQIHVLDILTFNQHLTLYWTSMSHQYDKHDILARRYTTVRRSFKYNK